MCNAMGTINSNMKWELGLQRAVSLEAVEIQKCDVSSAEQVVALSQRPGLCIDLGEKACRVQSFRILGLVQGFI